MLRQHEGALALHGSSVGGDASEEGALSRNRTTEPNATPTAWIALPASPWRSLRITKDRPGVFTVISSKASRSARTRSHSTFHPRCSMRSRNSFSRISARKLEKT